ncbi:MAG: histidine phosphatase family protein, partial [Solobacterium sp.]|nr:histidine phosphatase family protein [Solobacterium sp.]
FLAETAALDQNMTVLVSTHGTALRAMLNRLYEDPSDFWHGHVPYNCAVSLVETEDGTMVLKEDDRIFYDQSLIVDRYARNDSK